MQRRRVFPLSSKTLGKKKISLLFTFQSRQLQLLKLKFLSGNLEKKNEVLCTMYRVSITQRGLFFTITPFLLTPPPQPFFYDLFYYLSFFLLSLTSYLTVYTFPLKKNSTKLLSLYFSIPFVSKCSVLHHFMTLLIDVISCFSLPFSFS